MTIVYEVTGVSHWHTSAVLPSRLGLFSTKEKAAAKVRELKDNDKALKHFERWKELFIDEVELR